MAKNKNKALKKAVKKTSPITLIIVIMFFAVGLVGGFFGYKYLIKDDKFELIGEKEILVFQNDVIDENLYNQKSVNIVIFGKEAKDKLEITYDERGLDSSKLGTYYVTYKSKSVRFYNVTLVRKIIVQERIDG